MSKEHLVFLLAVFALSMGTVSAEAATGEGTITYSKKKLEFVDPENPEDIIDPGDQKQAGQYLRLELVPTLDFGMNDSSDRDESYYTKAQLFHNSTSARANYVQISDTRETGSGWGLYVKQEYQFRSKANEAAELNGAVLSFQNLWLNSSFDTEAPIIQSQVKIKLEPETTHHLVHAGIGQGVGTWLLSFGASPSNTAAQANTLIPQLDELKQPVVDPVYQKDSYLNQAISLTVPGKTKKQESIYQTKLTWILSELP